MANLTRDELGLSLKLRLDDATDSGNEYSEEDNGNIILPRKIHEEYWRNCEKIISQWYPLDIGSQIDKEFLVQNLITGVNKMAESEKETLCVIIDEFRAFNVIKSIYLQKFRKELQFFILLAIDQYDEELMDSLLEKEYRVRTMYPEIIFQFFYPPVGKSERKDLIHPEAECLYRKSNYGN